MMSDAGRAKDKIHETTEFASERAQQFLKDLKKGCRLTLDAGAAQDGLRSSEKS
jgi:hypothetical protein